MKVVGKKCKRKENFEMLKENDNLCRREGINHLG